MNKLLDAITWASIKHDGQLRKKNLRPYFTDHCMRLLAHVARDPVYGEDGDAAIIIVCHDVVEDCTEDDTDEERQVLYDELYVLAGQNVVNGVAELTNEFTKKRYPKRNRAERKRAELSRLKLISDRGMVLKLYDRHANLCDMIESKDWNKTYALETWNMAYELSAVLAREDRLDLIIKVLTCASQIRMKAEKRSC
jgi:hypothetical protein